MGGGGGGEGISRDEEKRVAEKVAKAKAELQRASEIRRTVFISFAHEDIDEINLLRGQAKNERSDLEFIDRSVRDPYESERAEYIKQRISERIRQSSVTVVYLTPDAAKSSWVNWEIERSLELDKKVIAVHKGENAPASLPKAVSGHDIKIVSWSDLAAEIDRDN